MAWGNAPGLPTTACGKLKRKKPTLFIKIPVATGQGPRSDENTPPPSTILPASPTKFCEQVYVGGYSALITFREKYFTDTKKLIAVNCTGDIKKNIPGLDYPHSDVSYNINNLLWTAEDTEPDLECFDLLIMSLYKSIREHDFTLYIHCYAGMDRSPFVAAALMALLLPKENLETILKMIDERSYFKTKHSVRSNRHLLKQWMSYRAEQEAAQTSKLAVNTRICCL